MGICNRATGVCKCRPGFEGLACERMSCPSSAAAYEKYAYSKGDFLNTPDCSGNGVCVSMAEAAANYDGVGLTNVTTYSLWDANKIFGCVCDDGFYGYDCSLQECPLGDDPLTTGQQDESQMIFCTCDGCSGTWTYSYRGETTEAIAYGATSTEVQTAIQALSSVTAATVAFTGTPGTAACEAAGNLITITFTHNPGDLIPGKVISSLTGGTNALAMRTVQTISCTCPGTCSGSMILKYRGQETTSIAYDATAADVDTALEALTTIGSDAVTVTYDTGTALCAASAVTTSVTFTAATTGNLAKIAVIHSLASDGGTPVITTATNDGTKEATECSNRGTCMSGFCSCYLYYTDALFTESNYTSSNGAGASGERGDCGRLDGAIHYSNQQTGCPWRLLENVAMALEENYTCSGHGHCAGSPTFKCDCAKGWRGGDCSERECATGHAWFDEASDTNVAHHPNTECSNRGICDRATGTCTCAAGFTGAACERLGCYGDPGKPECNGNGRCLTMSQLALLGSVDGVVTGATTYGGTPNTASAWDGDKISGCHCNDGYYAMPDRATGMRSYYCSQKPCPFGDNPMTGTVEIQTATCTGTSGEFNLGFDDGAGVQQTTVIAFDATAAVVEQRLEALSNIQNVAVAFSTGTAACSGAGVGITVTFTDTNSETADLNMLTAVVTDLQAGAGTVTFAETTKGTFRQNFEMQTLTCTATSGTFTLTFRGQTTSALAFDATAATVEAALEYMSQIGDVTVAFSTGTAACDGTGVGISVTFNTELGDVSAITADVASLQGGAGTISIIETTKGDKESAECSEHGTCDQKTGFCKCFRGFGSSDHDANQGIRRDCGKVNSLITGGIVAP